MGSLQPRLLPHVLSVSLYVARLNVTPPNMATTESRLWAASNLAPTLILEHKDVSAGCFNATILVSENENVGDPSSNTYSIIGELESEDWRQADGRFWFELVFRNTDNSSDTLVWAQESWLTDSTVVGANLFGVPLQNKCTFTGPGECAFTGLARSDGAGGDYSFLDGDGDRANSDAWNNSVGTLRCDWGSPPAIPGFNQKAAYGVSLYILAPPSDS